MLEFEPRSKSIPIEYIGVYSDDSVLDLQELGVSFQGLGKITNSIFNFYLDGEILKDSRRYRARFLAQAPERGSLLVNIVGEMVAGQLPLYGPMVWQASTDYVLPLIKAVISKKLNKETDLSKALDIISTMAVNQQQAFAQVQLGHMTDKDQLYSVIAGLVEKNSRSLKQFVAPIGKTGKKISVGANDNPAQTIIGEPEAEVLSSTEEMSVEDSKEYQVFFAAVDTINGSCKFRYLHSEKTFLGKITDPVLAMPQNPYTQSLNSQQSINVEAKALTKHGETVKLFISDTKAS